MPFFESSHSTLSANTGLGIKEFVGFDVGNIPDKVIGIPDTEYQFVKVLKANIGGLIGGKPGRTYYITFQVKDMAGSGSPTLNFRAVVKTLKGQATITFSALEP
ncbi:hypothetical protein C3L33_19065, partial [Rhododendron williamsianum]